ncbi:hypothetical protein P9139_06105 [Curtobacterium flaccumfaciens]|nr:hypothetical protein P9139_06105 [Curtobacterium flaccumfaciens]
MTIVVVVLVRVRRDAATPAGAGTSRPAADIAPAHTGARRSHRGAIVRPSDEPDFDDGSDDGTVIP